MTKYQHLLIMGRQKKVNTADLTVILLKRLALGWHLEIQISKGFLPPYQVRKAHNA